MAEREPSVLRVESEASAEGKGDGEGARLERPSEEPETESEESSDAGSSDAGSSDAGSSDAETETDSEVEAGAEERAPAASSGGASRAKGLRPAVPTFYVAGFWRRLAAAFLDLGIIVPVSLLLAWIAGGLTGIELPPSRHRGLDFWLDLLLAADPALIGLLGLTFAIGSVYVLVFQISMARTPGMRALKTRIIDLYGEEPTTLRAVLRTLGYLAGVATLGLGFFWIGFDREKRGLHDWISGTYVVKT